MKTAQSTVTFTITLEFYQFVQNLTIMRLFVYCGFRRFLVARNRTGLILGSAIVPGYTSLHKYTCNYLQLINRKIRYFTISALTRKGILYE